MRGNAKKKTKKVDYKKKADEVWSKLIRTKAVCEFADRGGCVGSLQAAHVIRRGLNSSRCDPLNGVCLCVKHHYWFDKGDRFETTRYFSEKFPGRYEDLHSRNKIVHYKNHDWQEIYENLKVEYEKALAQARDD